MTKKKSTWKPPKDHPWRNKDFGQRKKAQKAKLDHLDYNNQDASGEALDNFITGNTGLAPVWYPQEEDND